MTLGFILAIVATILLFCAAFGVPSGRVSLGWLGMAFWALSTILV